MLIAKTEAGLRVMKDRSVPLTPRQRSVLILIDGKRTLDEVVAASVAIGSSREDVDHLLALELITPVGEPAAAPAATPEAAEASADGRSPQQRYQDAYPIATRLTAELGLRGFRLNLAVEAAGNYEQLLQLAPKILDAVGKDKFAPLARALDLR
ncbi:hypothetical protein [Hydrogenophaga sp. T2]|uniref:hypothetical protein n=1 Tax=Hydrogenophaga sp. T2 TaxID=3132823 RepID=UPI003CF456BC